MVAALRNALREGEIERASGAVREGVGRAKRKAKDGIEEIAESVDDDVEE